MKERFTKMVKHMIIWKLKEGLENPEEKKKEIKEALEGLVGKIDGLLEMKIHICGMACSSGDLMMDSTFESAEALAFYQKHPDHVAIATGLVRPSVEQRLSFDF
jgi:hypothetical protein